MRLRVRHKLVLLSTAIVVGVAAGFVQLSTILTSRWIEEELRARGTIFARAIAATISTRDELQSGPVLRAQIRRIQEVRGDVVQLDVVAIGPDETRVVATTDPNARLSFPPRDAAEVLRGRVVSRIAGPPDAPRWEVMAPIALDGTVVGAIVTAFSPGPADRLAARLRTGAFALTGGAVLVMALLMRLAVSVVVDRPIQRFMTAIARIDAGEPTATVSVASEDEFGTLARHFNKIMARLQGFNDALQERVTAATAELDRRFRQVEHLNAMLFDLQRHLSRVEGLALSGRIMAEIAHEVGTPLHSVAGHLEILRKDMPSDLLDGEIGRRLAVVETQVARVIDTITRRLDFIRAAPGPAGPVDLNAVARDTAELVRPGVAAARLALELELASGLPQVYGQRHELQQVLLNLVTNAIDATSPGGRIRVVTRWPDPRDGVEDTGRGIPAADQRRIFDPFFTTKAGNGTGLGLAIASQIVRAYAGRIEVSSREGFGSTFRVSLRPVDATR